MSCKYLIDSHKSVFRSQYIALRSDVTTTEHGHVDSIYLVKRAFPSKFFTGQPAEKHDRNLPYESWICYPVANTDGIQSDHFLICVACVLCTEQILLQAGNRIDIRIRIRVFTD